MKEFQKKLQNKKCMDASKAQCAPETTNPALLAREDFTQIKSAYSGRRVGRVWLGVLLFAQCGSGCRPTLYS